MGTIGDLERKAGIGPSPARRTAFWQKFHHVEGQACLDAGVAELRRMIAAKEGRAEVVPSRRRGLPKRERLPPLTAELVAALQAYAVRHGRRWKSILNNVWMGGWPHDGGGLLRGLRNSHGPTWLQSYRLPKPTTPAKASRQLSARPARQVTKCSVPRSHFPFHNWDRRRAGLPSVLLRSKPAAVRFKAAIAPQCGRNSPSFTERVRALREVSLPCSHPNRLRSAWRARTLMRPSSAGSGRPHRRASRHEAGAASELERKKPWQSPLPPLVNPPASFSSARAPRSKWSDSHARIAPRR